MLIQWVVVTVLLQFCVPKGVSGVFNVSLAIFSGMPDPTWTVRETDPGYWEIMTHLKDAMKKHFIYSTKNIPSILGYKGILLTPIPRKRMSAEEVINAMILIVGPHTVKLQVMLFQTMPKSVISHDLRMDILKDIASGSARPQKASGKSKRHAPPFNVGPWGGDAGQLHNNCYNYATDKLTNTFAQPGRATMLPPLPYPPDTFETVRDCAISDGLKVLNVSPGVPLPANIAPTLGDQYHVVALFVSTSTNDFHWIRLDADGKWSHKIGKSPVTRLDYNENEIHDPRIAAMRTYQFYAFMAVDSNKVNID